MRDDRVGAGNHVLRDNGLIGVQVSVLGVDFILHMQRKESEWQRA